MKRLTSCKCRLKRRAKTHHEDEHEPISSGTTTITAVNNSNSNTQRTISDKSLVVNTTTTIMEKQQQESNVTTVKVLSTYAGNLPLTTTQSNNNDESSETAANTTTTTTNNDTTATIAAPKAEENADVTHKRAVSMPDSADISTPPLPTFHPKGPSSSSSRTPMARRQTTPANILMASMHQFGALKTVAEDSDLEESYRNIPLLETTELPRGGITIKTKAVGNVQYGIPPETIKDSMRLGLDVPYVYIVPVERFNREMGPALGVNLAEFEFPAYFNFFVQRRRCTLVVDNQEAETNIQKVFSETLLGPALFRRKTDPIAYQEEDFDPSFPREAIPNFAKELQHFRMMPNGEELGLETLLKFSYFDTPTEHECKTKLGVPPPLSSYDRMLSNTLPKVNSDNDMTTPNARSQRRISIKAFRDAETKAANTSTIKSSSDIMPNINDDAMNTGSRKTWTYGQVKWVGDVATVYESNATPEQIALRKCKRVEVFKMPGGGEYVLHDIDENNCIVGKARFLGQVRVPESVSVIDFKKEAEDVNTKEEEEQHLDDVDSTTSPPKLDEASIRERIPLRSSITGVYTPTFHPPSFGVTVLGNSHGFDKSGSTSGYVLWINGRGVMIDPPPYSSATLEREGIRPRTIVGIILTHCHADHDAGAFQKVLTGSPVVVITTPTIYDSFIRKYAALSALSPALLRHSHRYKRAVIGQALRFQGATFHFTYTLHSIPCVGFRVEWRGRSMVFTGDHMNIPSQIDKLQEKGVLTKARADDLRNLPLQETDLLLHESGAPPIHTPLEELLKLPARVKARLYVVHTSALPAGCELRVAPTGTAGTIRLDQLTRDFGSRNSSLSNSGTARDPFTSFMVKAPKLSSLTIHSAGIDSIEEEGGDEEDNELREPFSISEYTSVNEYNTFNNFGGQVKVGRSSMVGNKIPLVAVRPTSSTDAWFILNLLSAVPFMSSLSYASTMEVLETARVDAFCVNAIVVPAARRRDVLCVVWEGTCMEREQKMSNMPFIPKEKLERVQNGKASKNKKRLTSFGEITYQLKGGAVWYAGDWTGPRSLQPEKRLSGESSLARTHDIVAMSYEGVKVITIEFANLHAILQSGSPLYRKYLARKRQQATTDSDVEFKDESAAHQMQKEAMRNLSIIELLDNNSSFRKLNAVQKRHLESLAEGPLYYAPGQRLWRSGQSVDKAFIVVAGTVAFVAKRRNAQTAVTGGHGVQFDDMPSNSKAHHETTRENNSSGLVDDEQAEISSLGFGDQMRKAALKALKELNDHDPDLPDDLSAMSNASPLTSGGKDDHLASLKGTLKQRAASLSSKQVKPRRRSSSSLSVESGMHDFNEFVVRDDDSSENGDRLICRGENESELNATRKNSSRDRFANKVLGRLYSRRAATAGLVFSRGHFLGDVSKMVARLLSSYQTEREAEDDCSLSYAFGDSQRDPDNDRMDVHETIHESESDRLVVHSSTIAAGKDGCSVIVFPKSSLIPFLDEYPGLLLSLLGTQVVV